MHTHRRRQTTGSLSLDSLVDIVSNTVGILIILAVFMALFARWVVPAGEPTPPERSVKARPETRLLVPWSHATNKQAVFFQIRGNRMLHLDLAEFYRRLAEHSPETGEYPLDIELDAAEVRYYPVTNHVFCLEFQPHEDTGETWAEAQQSASRWQATRRQFPTERFYYYFWVAGDSFELFRTVREQLWEQGIEVGWRPIGQAEPLEICNGFEGSSSFQPQ